MFRREKEVELRPVLTDQMKEPEFKSGLVCSSVLCTDSSSDSENDSDDEEIELCQVIAKSEEMKRNPPPSHQKIPKPKKTMKEIKKTPVQSQPEIEFFTFHVHKVNKNDFAKLTKQETAARFEALGKSYTSFTDLSSSHFDFFKIRWDPHLQRCINSFGNEKKKDAHKAKTDLIGSSKKRKTLF